MRFPLRNSSLRPPRRGSSLFDDISRTKSVPHNRFFVRTFTWLFYCRVARWLVRLSLSPRSGSRQNSRETRRSRAGACSWSAIRALIHWDQPTSNLRGWTRRMRLYFLIATTFLTIELTLEELLLESALRNSEHPGTR